MTDHYAEAVRLLERAQNGAQIAPLDRANIIAAAQVSADLDRNAAIREMAAAIRPKADTAESAHLVTIPWPPSDDLVDKCADALYRHQYGRNYPLTSATPNTRVEYTAMARAVLGAVYRTAVHDE